MTHVQAFLRSLCPMPFDGKMTLAPSSQSIFMSITHWLFAATMLLAPTTQ